MDSFKKNPSPAPNPDSQKRTDFGDENSGQSHRGFGMKGPKKTKRILGEKNHGDAPSPNSFGTHFESTPQVKPMMGFVTNEASSQISPLSWKFSCSGAAAAAAAVGAYDPVTNFTSPRPEFLRYNPNRRMEILRRIEGEMRSEEEGSGVSGGFPADVQMMTGEESPSVSSAFSLPPSLRDEEIREFEEGRPRRCRTVWKLFLVFGVLLFSSHYLASMDSSVRPPFQEFDGSKGTGRKSFSGKLLEAHLGLSNMCLSGGELMCGVDGSDGELMASEDHFGESGIGYQGVDIGLLVSDEDILEFENGITLDAEADEDILAEDGTSSGGCSVTEENCEKPVSYHEFLEQGDRNERNSGVLAEDGNGEEEILGLETQVWFVSDDPFTFGEESHSGEELQGGESAHFSESTLVPQSQIASSLLPDRSPAEPENPAVSGKVFKWKHGSVLASKNFQLFYLMVALLAVTIGSVSGFLKYFPKPQDKLLPSSPPLPESPPCSESVDKKMITAAILEKDRCNEAIDVHYVPLNHVADEHKEFYTARPPTVELLGEFSLVETTVTESSQKLKRMGSEESKIFHYQRSSSIRQNHSPSAGIVHPYPSLETFSDGSHTAQEKPTRNEDYGDRTEVKKVPSTPVRRSTRIRNRVTSPMS